MLTIKTLLVNQRNASPQSLAKHPRYIERDGAGRDGEPGRAYGPQANEADLDAFKERWQEDRHHFRLIVSPEDGAELDDLRTYTRHLMGRMEADRARGSTGWRSITGHRQPARVSGNIYTAPPTSRARQSTSY